MFSIYEITGPTGKRYVGYTGQPVLVRFGQHLRRARKRKTSHPLYDSMKKYECLGFSVRVVCVVQTIEEAKEKEMSIIRAEKPEYNVSPGGEDWRFGFSELERLRSDPVFEVRYKKALSRGCKESEAHKKSWTRIKEVCDRFREQNPKEAYRNVRRASRLARKANIGKASWNAGLVGVLHHTEESLEKMRESKKKVLSCSAYREKLRLGAKRSWGNMSEEKRAERISKMSASLRKRNAEKREAVRNVG